MSYLDNKLIYWSIFEQEESPRQLYQSIISPELQYTKSKELGSFPESKPTKSDGKFLGLQTPTKDAQKSQKNFDQETDKKAKEVNFEEEEITCKNAVSITTSLDIITSIDAHPLKPHVFCLGSLDKYIRLYDVQQDHIVDWYQSTDFITAVAFSPDARLLVVGFSHGLCRVYSMHPILRYRCDLNCRNSNVKEVKASKVINIKFVNEDEFIVASSDDRIRLFDCSDLRNSKLKYKGHLSSGPILRADCDRQA